MKQIEMTILARDADRVIEYLGGRAVLHLSGETGAAHADETWAGETEVFQHILDNLESLKTSAGYLGVELPEEPLEDTALPTAADDALAGHIGAGTGALSARENEQRQERKRVGEAFAEARAFENLNAPFADLDQLSYLTLRVGRLDPKRQAGLRETLGDRAVIIPLGPAANEDGQNAAAGDRILAAASRKGRFALDSELKKYSFTPITIPEGYKGVPTELLSGLEERLSSIDGALAKIGEEKKRLKDEYGPVLRRLTGSYLMASQVERLKGRLRSTQSAYQLSGWAPADQVGEIAKTLGEITEGRAAIRTFLPEEIPDVREGREKVPVSLEHGAFVRGFEKVVFSYGAPLYGAIDPTPFVAVSFAVLFGIMFGDLGQGFVLFLLGLLTGRKGPKFLKNFRKYSTPLVAVGIASMAMGLLTGEVFTNAGWLAAPTQAVTGFFMRLFDIPGEPPRAILHLMPEKGNIIKLFYFFGFTISVGIILNSIGLLVNIANLVTMRKYEKAFFSKTGLAGLLLFWYAVFIAVRIMLGGRFGWFDLAGLLFPVFCIFFGPVIWRVVVRERPILPDGFMVFIMEALVEVLETASTYVSNTVSFLRVGAFALSHAVLSFIIFTLTEMVVDLPVGPALALIIMIAGNTLIIVLEGMIVAIQVVRLQYYEFFSKFFTETGVEFKPFRFRKGESQ
ncbi:MAG: V-type ATP synthase subunit I [Treponema sp.]|jgi:V/A-type H+-transporting ATPase subunit I|nr:V-type ATP synthase subunit I [Treponema sp.]